MEFALLLHRERPFQCPEASSAPYLSELTILYELFLRNWKALPHEPGGFSLLVVLFPRLPWRPQAF
jgi:hypothetical protein